MMIGTITTTSAITTATPYAVTATAGTAGAAVITVTGATSTSTGTPTSTGVELSPATKSISTVAAISARIASNPHNGPPDGSPISATGADRPIRKRCKNGSDKVNNRLWPDSGSVLPRRFQLQRGDLPEQDNGLPQERYPPSAGHPAPTFRNASRKSPEPRTSSRTNCRNPSPRRVTFKSGLGRVPGIMRCKASKTPVRSRVWRAGGGRKAANQQHLLLVTFKPVKPQAESVSSARRLKSPGKPPRKGSHRSRSGKPRCLNKQAAQPGSSGTRTNATAAGYTTPFGSRQTQCV